MRCRCATNACSTCGASPFPREARRFTQDATLEDVITRAHGFTCLANRQAVERGMRQELGMIRLNLDADQYGALCNPR